jgi:hypothetical protein
MSARRSIAPLHKNGAPKGTPYRAEPSNAQSPSPLRPKPIRRDGVVQEGTAPYGAKGVAGGLGI